MVKQISFFIEGQESPKARSEDAQLRRTLHRFFQELDALAKAKRITLQFRFCGTRRAAYDRFRLAAGESAQIYPVLLVDSEGPVREPGKCWEHLRHRTQDTWERPAGAAEDQCQLMVQAIEAWLLADPSTLAAYYGKGFRGKSLPPTEDVEAIAKERHLPSLEAATRNTGKGRYHKVKHLAPLLARIDVATVRRRAPHCERIFSTLRARIEQQPLPGV